MPIPPLIFYARRRTGSIKYDKYLEDRDASHSKYLDVLPLWVADMDFEIPAPVKTALQKRIEHGIFGYPAPDWPVKSAILSYLQREHDTSVTAQDLVFLPGLVVPSTQPTTVTNLSPIQHLH